MKYITATTRLSESKLKELKEKTGEKSNKEAIAKAVQHYVSCPYTEKEERRDVKKKKTGRRPVYLDEIFREWDEHHK